MYVVFVDPHHSLYGYLGSARRKGFRTLVLTSDAARSRRYESLYHAQTGQPDVSDVDELIECDVLSAEDILTALKPYADRIAGILPGNESGVPPGFEAARALGFDAAPPEDARCQRLKSEMKQRLAERGVRTSPFRIVRTLAEAEAAWEEFGRDCMVKVADADASLHVYRVSTVDELRSAWAAIEADGRHPDVIAERFVGGRELSAEGYVCGDRVTILNTCEKVTTDRFVVIGHYVPAHLSAPERAGIDELVTDCVRALGIRNSVFHAEVHIEDGVPYLIECASRPPGQLVIDIIRWAYDIDLTEVNIDLAVGRDVRVAATAPKYHYAQVITYAHDSGVYTATEGMDELYRRGGVKHRYLGVSPGDRIEALSNFRHRYGFVVLEDDTADGVRAKAEWAHHNVWLRVDAD
jgi:biotin carboxylase